MQVELAGSLVLRAEEQPALVADHVGGDLDGLAGSDGVLAVQSHLPCQPRTVLDPFLQQQVQVDLQPREDEVLLLVVRKTPDH